MEKKRKKIITRKSLNETIYQDIKDRILKGSLSSDLKLQEDNLTEDYSTSRTPIRDALRRLEQENLIEKLHYGGYKIRELTLKEIEEVYGIRRALESYAASLATQRIKPQDIGKLEEILERSRRAASENDYTAFIQLNTEFHRFLYFLSDSELLIKILKNVWDYFYRYRRLILNEQHNLEAAVRDHEAMIAKMKVKDAEAVEKLVKEHVDDALKVLLKQIEKDKKIQQILS